MTFELNSWNWDNVEEMWCYWKAHYIMLLEWKAKLYIIDHIELWGIYYTKKHSYANLQWIFMW
jgi:hypothetical protein